MTEPTVNNEEFARQHPGLVTLRYTVLRLVLLVAWSALFIALQFPLLVALMTAFVISGITSWFLLKRQRENMSVGVTSLLSRVNDRIEKSKTKEDFD
jgi:hypothetical protein